MNRRALLLILALGAWAVGCSEREERQVSAKEEFEIPLTLVQRMMEAHDKVYSNAQEVVTQPRGEMRFADDGLMMRRHQCDRSSMDPLAVKSFLETARKRRAPFAAENLAVLRRCVPEVFMKKTDGPL